MRQLISNNSLIIYAPNVHVGGGLVLLKYLLHELKGRTDVILFLDERVELLDFDLTKFCISRVKAGILFRVFAEFKLYFLSNKNSIVLCFHSIPPLLPTSSRLIIFIQNRLLISRKENTLSLKRVVASFLIRLYCGRVSQFIVQTNSMKHELNKVFLNSKNNLLNKINVCPFAEFVTKGKENYISIDGDYFIYVADGWDHKNHINLIKAWKILLDYGIKPRLLLTVSARHIKLLSFLDACMKESPIRVENIGSINREELFKILSGANALIYPSATESFGLPLLEASHLQVPIIAAEKDYVRDVCSPVETFDPSSPLSIARAIMRHLGVEVHSCEPVSARDFLAIVERADGCAL